MKYVIVNQTGIEVAILSPEAVPHSQIANRREAKVVSAGFCKVDERGRVRVWGRSVGLDLPSREADAWVIEFSLRNMGLAPAAMPATVRTFHGVEGGAPHQASPAEFERTSCAAGNSVGNLNERPGEELTR